MGDSILRRQALFRYASVDTAVAVLNPRSEAQCKHISREATKT